MGPNPIMQARSDFYDDDSIMYTYVCVRVYVRLFSSVFQILSFAFICCCLARCPFIRLLSRKSLSSNGIF